MIKEQAELAELADALDSGSSAHKASGFKSRVPHLKYERLVARSYYTKAGFGC